MLRNPALWAFLLIGALAPMGAWAQDAGATPRVSVHPVKVKKGPNLKRYMKRFLEKPLRQTADVVNSVKFKKAMRKAKVKTRDAGSPAGAAAVGKEAGLTHVIIVQGIRRKEGRRPTFHANVIVIGVESGDVLHTKEWTLKGKRITKALGEEMAADLVQVIKPEATEPPEPEPEEPPDMPAPPEPPPPMEDPPPDAPAPPPVAELEPEPEPEEVVLVPSGNDEEEEPPLVSKLPVVQTIEEEEEAPPPKTDRGRWRPGMRLSIGALTIRRTGTISATGAVRPPCYCGRDGSSNPFFPAGVLQLELYPFAFGGDGSFHEGIGLHAEGYFTQVKTVVDPTTAREVSSTIFSFNGGLTLRMVFWDSVKAPDFKLKAGYGFFAFPLSEGAFPGLQYGAPYVGGQFTFPLGTKYVALFFGGQYSFLLSAGDDADQLGASDSGSAFRGEGGFRISISPVEIHLAARYDQVTTSYTGDTTLNSPTQFQNVELTDKLLGGFGTIGVAF